MGTSSQMLVRFGRRCGQARESTGELNGPIPAQGLFLAPGHGLRGEGAKRGLWLPSKWAPPSRKQPWGRRWALRKSDRFVR